MAKYSIPWSGMMPVAGMTILVALMGPALKMYDEYFITGGKVLFCSILNLRTLNVNRLIELLCLAKTFCYGLL